MSKLTIPYISVCSSEWYKKKEEANEEDKIWDDVTEITEEDGVGHIGSGFTGDAPTAIWRRKQVQGESGLSRSTLYVRIAQGLWTKPVRLGPRAVGWPASEVVTLNAARIAGKSDDEIRALVAKLEASRRNSAPDNLSGSNP